MLKLNLKIILFPSVVVLLMQINVIWADVANNNLLKDPKIVNGADARLDATGHQVSIRKRLDSDVCIGEGHTCGGSLISDNIVLSAAHCFVDPKSSNGSLLSEKEFIVVMGNLDRLKCNNNTLIFDILKIIKRVENFNSTTFADDLVLLVLNGRVPAKHATVKPITLNGGPVKNNTICQTTGWGLTENNTRSDKLKTVDLTYIDTDHCRNNTVVGSLISEGMICAGYLQGGRGPCSADSGGPLVCKGIQAGVVSWGASNCTAPLSPTVYADVAYYKNWILNEVTHHKGTLPIFDTVPNGVTCLSCSIFLISLKIIFDFQLLFN